MLTRWSFLKTGFYEGIKHASILNTCACSSSTSFRRSNSKHLLWSLNHAWIMIIGNDMSSYIGMSGHISVPVEACSNLLVGSCAFMVLSITSDYLRVYDCILSATIIVFSACLSSVCPNSLFMECEETNLTSSPAKAQPWTRHCRSWAVHSCRWRRSPHHRRSRSATSDS